MKKGKLVKLIAMGVIVCSACVSIFALSKQASRRVAMVKTKTKVKTVKELDEFKGMLVHDLPKLEEKNVLDKLNSLPAVGALVWADLLAAYKHLGYEITIKHYGNGNAASLEGRIIQDPHSFVMSIRDKAWVFVEVKKGNEVETFGTEAQPKLIVVE